MPTNGVLGPSCKFLVEELFAIFLPASPSPSFLFETLEDLASAYVEGAGKLTFRGGILIFSCLALY